ncbi:hypothetical protein FPOAC2_06819 [Fusarium poae]|jgi:hypothetical protein|uniref:Extracellular membrane protein CFEM domain-containing protein n=1 Tax=Fusarium poae TaxID=36050 RepID=A0A1B8AYH4_FUSPO|nr:hypothetical protein FPOAC1_006688 [Fusarium poae]KAG8673376.1 hypothetical protein FPOAC1_006688 [Fusarium poae]OBS25572.1 hypothetical protein FPOA_06106 [Fusarium poae]
MRLPWARQAAIYGLLSVAVADVLPVDDIPLMCVTICGPIVELTSKCDIHGQRMSKRQVDSEWVPKLAVEPPLLDKRSFSIIRAAPTSFPPEFTPEESTTTSLSSWTTEETSSTVDQVSTKKRTTMASMLMDTTTATQTTLSTSGTSGTSKTSQEESQTASGTWHSSLQTNAPDEGDPERDCVCLNKSFDVAKISALCQNCIVVDGHKQNNMDIIMKACGFESRTYTPDKDSEVDNVRVEATRPTSMGMMGDAPANTASGAKVLNVFWVGIFSSLLGFAMVL